MLCARFNLIPCFASKEIARHGVVALLVIAIGAFLAFQYFGDEDEPIDGGVAGVLATCATATPEAEDDPTATLAPQPTSTREATAEIAATPTVVPAATPPVPPGVEFAHITDITWHVVHQHYHVSFDMYELDILHPDGIDDPQTAQLASPHVHYFGNAISPEQAGVPGNGPWDLYASPSPYNFDPANIPAGSTEICVLIANPDHSVKPDTGNCVPMPPRE